MILQVDEQRIPEAESQPDYVHTPSNNRRDRAERPVGLGDGTHLEASKAYSQITWTTSVKGILVVSVLP